MFFKDVDIVKSPKSDKKVIFQCDQFYFEKFGLFNLASCVRVGLDVHIHFINTDKKIIDFLSNKDLPIDLSLSTEKLDTDINFYKLKSYYFCSRYFITSLLFQNSNLSTAYVVDADIVFNESVSFESRIDLGVLHYPNQNNLWKKSGANFLLVKKNKQQFIHNLVKLYNEKIKEIDFESINDDMDKFSKANLYGLDQVCISTLIDQEQDFFNLTSINRLISKSREDSKIWSFTGGGTKSDPNLQSYLQEKFKDELRFFQF